MPPVQIVHFSPRLWELGLLLTIGLSLAWWVRRRPTQFWPALIVVNILGIGPSLMKYFFWDKALTGFIILGALCRRPGRRYPPTSRTRRNGHVAVFTAWIVYLVVESVVGVVANSDWRIIFWAFFYSLLGVLSYILCYRRRDFPFPSLRQCSIIILVSVLTYNVALLVYGVIVEEVIGLEDGRFAAQFVFRDSFVFAPPSVSSYPVLIGLPAAIFVLNDASYKVRALALCAVGIMIAAAVYYDSRAAYFVIACVFLLSLRKVGILRIVAVSVIFTTLYRPSLDDRSMWSFFNEEIFASVSILWSPSDRDLPRQRHTVAGFLRVTDNVRTFFVGDGFYSHKTTIIPFMAQATRGVPVQKISIESQSLRDDAYLRTNAFTALLIDTGVVGMLTLVLLFVLAGYKVLSSKGPHRAVLLCVLLLAFGWQFSVNTTGIVLFYLLFMPFGLVEQLGKAASPEVRVRRRS